MVKGVDDVGTKRSEDGKRHQPSDAAEAVAEAHRRLTTGLTDWLATHGFADATPAMSMRRVTGRSI